MSTPDEPDVTNGSGAPDPAHGTGAGGGTGTVGVTPGRIDRTKAAANQAVARVTAVAEAARSRSRVVDTVWSAGERDRRSVGGVLAGALAFRLFVYLLPLFLALLTLAGVLVGLDDDAPTEVGERMGLSSYVVRSVATATRQAHQSLWVLVPLAAWAIYTAGSAMARVLYAVHRLAWGLPPQRMRRRAAAAALTFLVAVLAVVLVAWAQWARARSAGPGVAAAAGSILPFTLLWLAVSRLLPRAPGASWVALLPGSLLFGVSAWLAHLFSVYVLADRVEQASNLYGSLGVAAALLAWLYLLGRVMVAAAMLNATLWEGRNAPDGEGRSEEPGASASAATPGP